MDPIKILEAKFVPLFKDLMGQTSRYSNQYELEVLDHKIVESSLGNDEYADYMKEGATKDAVIKINYRVKDKESGKVLHTDEAKNGILSAEFYVPITLHNLFIIDGRVRAPLNYLDKNNLCARYGEYRLSINGSLQLEFESNEIWYSPDGDYQFSIRVPFSKINTLPAGACKLTDECSKLLFLQYDFDIPPKELTLDVIEKLRVVSDKDRDHIVFKKIVSAYDALLIHLTRRETKRLLLAKTRTRFYKLQKYYESTVNSSIKSFFKGQSDYLVGVQNESNINPATYETLANKVILERNANGGDYGAINPTDYNESLALLVDPSMTPDSFNVNRINEMNKAIKYDGLSTKIKVIDINSLEQIELDLLDFLSNKILSSSHFDYTNNRLLPMKKGDQITYRFKGDYHKGFLGKDIKLSDFKYVDVHSDDRLSRSTRMIPNINFSDSVRTSMGSRMLNQAIEIVSGEEPIVGTGHKDFKDLSLFVNSKDEGIVKGIKDNSVIIETKDGDVPYKIPENLNATYDINVSFEVLPKPGDKVQIGDPIIKPKSISKDGTPQLGLNALVAFANYKGYTYEDGAVVSQSFANKLTHIYIIDVEHVIQENDDVKGLTPIGTQVKSPDILAKIGRRKSASAQVRSITNIFFPEEEQELEFPHDAVVPNNIYEGYLVDFTYSRGSYSNAQSEQVVADYYKRANRNVKLPFDYHYNRLGRPTNDKKEMYVMKLIFRIVVRAPAVVGDKISNRYGSKGVITKIIPDKEMWRLEDGRIIDCILNPFAVMSRKNISQTMEAGLTMVAEGVYNKIISDKLLDKPKDLRKLLDKFMMKSYLPLSDEEIRNKIIADGKLYYIIGCYGKITPKDIAKFMDDLNLKDGKFKVFKSNGRPLRGDVVCGYQYMVKLMFLVSNSNKVTGDDEYSTSMVLGYGGEKAEGQSLEEMIFWALQSHGATDAIDTFRSTSGRSGEYWLRAHILTAGLDLNAKDK